MNIIPTETNDKTWATIIFPDKSYRLHHYARLMYEDCMVDSSVVVRSLRVCLNTCTVKTYKDIEYHKIQEHNTINWVKTFITFDGSLQSEAI